MEPMACPSSILLRATWSFIHPKGWFEARGEESSNHGIRTERAELKHAARDVYNIFGVRVIVGLPRGYSVLEIGS